MIYFLSAYVGFQIGWWICFFIMDKKCRELAARIGVRR